MNNSRNNAMDALKWLLDHANYMSEEKQRQSMLARCESDFYSNMASIINQQIVQVETFEKTKQNG